MNFKIKPNKEPLFLFLLSLLAFLELVLSGVATLFITPDPKNALIFGFSALRLLLVGGTWSLAILILAAGILARKNQVSLDSAWLLDKRKSLRLPIYVLSFVLIIWGWLSLVCPAYLFGKLIYSYERLRPFSIALGVILVQSWLLFLFAKGRLAFLEPGKAAVRRYYRPTLPFAAVIIVLGIFIASTKFGLLANLIYTNVPGIPFSGLQWFFLLLLAALLIAWVPNQEQPFLKIVKRYRLIPILVFLTAVMVWGFTPMLNHYFSLEPAAPSYQPFPYSDARVNDLGGISILQGYGIYFYKLADKPLYMVFLAVLHLFAGYNYTIMTWLQILVLACIPVILFYLGVKFHSTIFGIFLSLVVIIRQRNAIVLSKQINSVNPKLFMTEVITLLGIVLFAYLVFTWMRERKIWQALLCGGCIGAASLIRLNPFLLFPAMACLIVPVFWKMGKKLLLRHLSAYTLAFLILVTPGVISSVSPDGSPYLLLKFYNVIRARYEDIDTSQRGYRGPSLPETGMTAVKLDGNIAFIMLQAGSSHDRAVNDFSDGTLSPNIPSTLVKDANIFGGTVDLFLYHFLQNFSASVMSMPDSLVYDDLNHMSKRVYWIDKGDWQGDLPVAQTILIFLNLILVAIGLGYSWVKHRWAGMVPFITFVVYIVALSAAMTSGGRYLVPIDWIIYFYHGLAILAIMRFIRKVVVGKDQSQPVGLNPSIAGRNSDRRNLVFSLVGIVCLASLIPIANFVVPAVTASAKNLPDLEAARVSISAQEAPGTNVISGEILYPYEKNGILLFDFFTPQGSKSYKIVMASEMNAELNNGEYGFIVLGGSKKTRLDAVYLWQDMQPLLLWKRQP